MHPPATPQHPAATTDDHRGGCDGDGNGTDSESGVEAWESYRGGIRGVVAVLTGRAASGVGTHTLAAALTAHLLGVIGVVAVSLGVWWQWQAGALAVGCWVVLCCVQARSIVALRRAPRLAQGGVAIAGWNLLNSNTASNVRDGVAACDAEILVLFETEQRHLDAAAGAQDGRTWYGRPRDGSALHDGIACGVRDDAGVVCVEFIDIAGMAAVRVEVQSTSGRFAVWGYRPAAPTDPERRAAWRTQLTALTATLTAEPLPYVLLGDLNSTVWHVPFQSLVSSCGLRRGGQLFGGTWQHHRIGWRARIDHIYAGPGIATRGAWRSAAHGSDHRPIGCNVGCA